MLAEKFRLIADSLEPMQPNQPAPIEFYRVHIRLEKSRGEASPTLSYW